MKFIRRLYEANQIKQMQPFKNNPIRNLGDLLTDWWVPSQRFTDG